MSLIFIQLLWKFPEVRRSKIVVTESTIISDSEPVQSIAHLQNFFLESYCILSYQLVPPSPKWLFLQEISKFRFVHVLLCHTYVVHIIHLVLIDHLHIITLTTYAGGDIWEVLIKIWSIVISLQLEWVGDITCDVQWPPPQCSVGTDYLWCSGSFQNPTCWRDHYFLIWQAWCV